MLIGKYRIPYHVSKDCEALVHQILVKDVAKRTNMDGILSSKWVTTKNKFTLPATLDHDQHNEINTRCLDYMSRMGHNLEKVEESVKIRRFDTLHCIYRVYCLYKIYNNLANLPKPIINEHSINSSAFNMSVNSTSSPAQPLKRNDSLGANIEGLVTRKLMQTRSQPPSSVNNKALDYAHVSQVPIDEDLSMLPSNLLKREFSNPK